MRWLKKHFLTILLVAMVLVGVGLLAYPSFSNWWNSLHQSRAVASYAQAAADMDTARHDAMLKAAADYNAALAKTGVLWHMSETDLDSYNAQLNVTDSGIMGYIHIPKIQEELPIYHGTDESILQIAVGHLAGTSLPVGGESSHAVLSGHRGLPSARLFTDIDQLAVGDTFTITVLDQTLTYAVDQIRIVLPTEVSDLEIIPGADLCTLLTCTPYGINTHRLLVRGRRVADPEGQVSVSPDALQIKPVYIVPFIAVPLLLLLLVGAIVHTGARRRRRTPGQDSHHP